MALTDEVHELIRSHFTQYNGLVAIDATCGNGFDTEFLCSLKFEKVYAFDVQEKAIEASRSRLSTKGSQGMELHQISHEIMHTVVKHKVDCIMFNFGYLPGGDKSITTKAKSSIAGLNCALALLNDNGIMTLMCYPGHPEGAIETQAIKAWLTQASKTCTVEVHLPVSPKTTAPILFAVKK